MHEFQEHWYVLSASAFGSADNTYFELDYSGYHKNLIQ